MGHRYGMSLRPPGADSFQSLVSSMSLEYGAETIDPLDQEPLP
jgi:hypothetical protein